MSLSADLVGGECQCMVCGRVFGGLRNFDDHQKWTGKGDKARLECRTPQIMGLERRERRGAVEVWVSPLRGEVAWEKGR